ncbi:NAD(P)H-dependent oxidoreductase [Blastomonas sp. RAC04]
MTPEYNRSVPAALKKAIDVVARPRPQQAGGGYLRAG